MNDFIYAIKETKWYIFWYIIFIVFTQLTTIQPFTKFVLWILPFLFIYAIGTVMIEQRKIYKKYLDNKGDE
jgi:hypothetical protein